MDTRVQAVTQDRLGADYANLLFAIGTLTLAGGAQIATDPWCYNMDRTGHLVRCNPQLQSSTYCTEVCLVTGCMLAQADWGNACCSETACLLPTALLHTLLLMVLCCQHAALVCRQ